MAVRAKAKADVEGGFFGQFSDREELNACHSKSFRCLVYTQIETGKHDTRAGDFQNFMRSRKLNAVMGAQCKGIGKVTCQLNQNTFYRILGSAVKLEAFKLNSEAVFHTLHSRRSFIG